MQKIITLGFILFVSSFGFANSSITTNSLSDIHLTSKSENLKFTAVEIEINPIVQKNDVSISSELPEAVLRLHDLKKVNYRGEIIYTHTPLEMSTLKAYIKIV